MSTIRKMKVGRGDGRRYLEKLTVGAAFLRSQREIQRRCRKKGDLCVRASVHACAVRVVLACACVCVCAPERTLVPKSSRSATMALMVNSLNQSAKGRGQTPASGVKVEVVAFGGGDGVEVTVRTRALH